MKIMSNIWEDKIFEVAKKLGIDYHTICDFRWELWEEIEKGNDYEEWIRRCYSDYLSKDNIEVIILETKRIISELREEN
jgi:phage anti-repressor protein